MTDRFYWLKLPDGERTIGVQTSTTGWMIPGYHDGTTPSDINAEIGTEVRWVDSRQPLQSRVDGETVRVLRILEYTGPRAAVEEQVAQSVSGEKTWGRPGREVTLRAATIGTYPEIIHPRRINADAIGLLSNLRDIVSAQSERSGADDDRHAIYILASTMLYLKGHTDNKGHSTINNWWGLRKWEVPGK